jgi:hypothetical protein
VPITVINKQEHALPPIIALGQLLVERGYLVYGCNDDLKVGDVVRGLLYGKEVDQPCYVIGESTKSEFISWAKRLDELTGLAAYFSHIPYKKFYRVATD